MRRSGGRQLWIPLNASGLESWHDASDFTSLVLDGNNGCSQLRDKSGNSKHFNQGQADCRPKADRTLNGLNVLNFDGIDDTMLTTQSLANGIFEVHMVTVNDSTSFSHILTGSNNGPFKATINTSTNIGLDAGASISANLPHDFGSSEMYGFLVNGGGSQIYTRGVTRVTGNAGNGNFGTNAWLFSDTGFQHYLDGKFAEMIVFSGNDGFQRQKIEGYLCWKWGLQSQLPSGHPFEFSPPFSGI